MNNPYMYIIFYLLISVLVVSIHADHKRVIIKVPQRTKHIYHHHVKKVPVYVLLPEKKSKILDDLEATRPATKAPCKDSDDRENKLTRYRPSYAAGQEKVQVIDWTEDRENRGAFVPSEQYRTLESDLPPPPQLELYDLPFRRANLEMANDNKNIEQPLPQQQVYQHQNYQSDYQQQYTYEQLPQPQQPPPRIRKANSDHRYQKETNEYRPKEKKYRQQEHAVSITYAPETNESEFQGSYQYNSFEG